MEMRDLTPLERAGLEQLIDICGLSSVVMALSDICDEKAEHIRSNWQDKPLARQWAKACGRLGTVVPSLLHEGL
jgi:hypothetical protein